MQCCEILQATMVRFYATIVIGVPRTVHTMSIRLQCRTSPIHPNATPQTPCVVVAQISQMITNKISFSTISMTYEIKF